MQGLCRRFVCAAVAGLLVLAAASSGAQPAVPAVRQVLVLQPFDRGNLIVDAFTGHFRVELDQRAGTPVNVIQVVVGPTGFVTRQSERLSTTSEPSSPVGPSRTSS